MITEFGPYHLEARIATGGMAEVFRATKDIDGSSRQVVALKRLLPSYFDLDEYVSMFKHEARIQAHLSHPNIVAFRGLYSQPPEWFIELEYFRSLSLAKIFSTAQQGSTRWPWQAVAYVGIEVSKALKYVHEARDLDGQPLNIVHRDINPQNILVNQQGWLKLSDFGISKSAIQHEGTRAGALKGKMIYMAPEQLEGKAIECRSDLFSLGVTLVELLNGVHPFAKRTESLSSEAIRREDPLIHADPLAHFPAPFVMLLLQLLQKSPDSRPQSAAQVLTELTQVQDEGWIRQPHEKFAEFLESFLPSNSWDIEEPIRQTQVWSSMPEVSDQTVFDREIVEKPSELKFYWFAFMTALCLGLFFWWIPKRSRVPSMKTTPTSVTSASALQATSVPLSSEGLLVVQTPSSESNVSQPALASESPESFFVQFFGPAGHSVYLNGKFLGTLPLPGIVLPRQHYTVTITAPAGTRQNFQVSSKSRSPHRITWKD